MFGKRLPVRDRFDNLRLDYIDKSHLVGDQRYSDRLTYDGMWENNLFNFVTMVLPKLTRELPPDFVTQISLIFYVLILPIATYLLHD